MSSKRAASNGAHFEIEHKYLCSMPLKEELDRRAKNIFNAIQTYLIAPKGEERRVRKKISGNGESFVYTSKRKISELKRVEEEKEISEAEYEKLLKKADSNLHPIKKTRFVIPYKNHDFEIDIYDFEDELCIMEVEVSSEDEEFETPDFIHIIKEVTDDSRFKNKALASFLSLRM